MDKAVILAAGLGTRMRRSGNATVLSNEQARIASRGIKALIPFGRPFLDFVLARLADAGIEHICLVIGPHHDEIRNYYENVTLKRLRVVFAIQPQPMGTANAVGAAADFVQEDPFLVINSDNLYPTSAIHALRETQGPATAGFQRSGLLRGGNIPAERIAKYAVLTADAEGNLARIVEKPDPQWLETQPEPILVSMNCWRFDVSMIEACRRIRPSSRGEYEIPDAVAYSMKHQHVQYQVVPCSRAVLDLTGPEDIESIQELLAHEEVRL